MKPMLILLAVLSVAVLALVAAILYFTFLSSTPNPRLMSKTLTVGNAVFNVEIANTSTTRARGLSGRENLGENQGMLFIFDAPGNYGFWMKDMRFPLDFVWILGDKIVGVTENVPPPAPGASIFKLQVYYPPDSADKVLELNAGEVKKYGIQAGQTAILTE
jgi:uncharacterized membrane protein (UPF0127 family)